MYKFLPYRNIAFMALLTFTLTSCGTTGGQFLASNAPPKGGKIGVREVRDYTYSESHQIIGNPVYKIGDPYQIKGQWFKPEVDYSYDQTGIASWYGKKFHGRRTANGEIFDKDRITAAHQTLPLPSILLVTNLQNGRSIKIRVNDRGPFARGRILDVSERAADILGFRQQGTTTVRVRILAEESRKAALEVENFNRKIPAKLTRANPKGQSIKPLGKQKAVDYQTLVPIGQATEPENQPEASLATVEGALAIEKTNIGEDKISAPRVFIQVGAFQNDENIKLARKKISHLGYPVEEQAVSSSELVRVRIGPLDSLDAGIIETLLDKLSEAGYPESHVRVEQPGL